MESGVSEQQAPSTKKEASGFVPLVAPTIEWVFHKTDDGSHPDGNEQGMFWLMNRARTKPEEEGIYLTGITQGNVVGNFNFFGVDLAKARGEFALLTATPPGAFDRRLYEASKAHSEHMIAIDTQTHDGQISKVAASGFVRNGGSVSVFWRVDDPVHGHAALNVDWGFDGGVGDGMQVGRGHRASIMGSRPNVGIAMVPDTDLNFFQRGLLFVNPLRSGLA